MNSVSNSSNCFSKQRIFKERSIKNRLLGGVKSTINYGLEAKDLLPFVKYYTLKKERDFLRRIPSSDWNRLLNKIAEIDINGLTSEVLKAFLHGHFNHIVFKKSEWIFLAFYAYLNGALDEMAMAKLLLYDACCFEFSSAEGLKIYQLVDSKNKVDIVALKVLQEQLRAYFDEDCIKKIVERICFLPPEKSQFFKIKHHRFSRFLEALHLTGVKLCLQCDFETKRYVQTVIPPEFVREILKVRFGSSARLPNPVLGFFKKEKMSQVDRRVVSLGLRDYITLPKLHGLDETPLVHYQHDAMYHAFIDSVNIHLKLWIELGKFFKGDLNLRVACFDGDFPHYRGFVRSLPTYSSLLGKPLVKDYELFWGALVKVLIKSDQSVDIVADLFIDFMKSREKEMDQKYGLNFNNLSYFLAEMNVRLKDPNLKHPLLEGFKSVFQALTKKI